MRLTHHMQAITFSLVYPSRCGIVDVLVARWLRTTVLQHNCFGGWEPLCYSIIVQTVRENGYWHFMKRKSIVDSRSVENITDKKLRIEVQPQHRLMG